MLHKAQAYAVEARNRKLRYSATHPLYRSPKDGLTDAERLGERTNMTTTQTKPEAVDTGVYRYQEFLVERVHSRRWKITRPGKDFEGYTESLTKATAAIDRVLAEETTEVEPTPEQAPVSADEPEAKAEEQDEPPVEKPEAPAKKPTPDKDSPDRLVGHKITVGIIHDIRAGFDRLESGKVAYYKAKAKEHRLGVETVAKISRRDIYKEVE